MAKQITDTSIEFKLAGELKTGTILANKGICWQVLSEGETFLVQKKHVTRQWEPTQEELDAAKEDADKLDELYNQPHTLAQQLAGGPVPEPTNTAKVKDPDLITLSDLCAEYKLVGRIARRRLRAAFGTIGTGSRWEWKKDSAELAGVRLALVGQPAPAPEAEPTTAE